MFGSCQAVSHPRLRNSFSTTRRDSLQAVQRPESMRYADLSFSSSRSKGFAKQVRLLVSFAFFWAATRCSSFMSQLCRNEGTRRFKALPVVGLLWMASYGPKKKFAPGRSGRTASFQMWFLSSHGRSSNRVNVLDPDILERLGYAPTCKMFRLARSCSAERSELNAVERGVGCMNL